MGRRVRLRRSAAQLDGGSRSRNSLLFAVWNTSSSNHLSAQREYEGRIVFKGDQVRDADGNPILFGAEEAAATPTGLVGLAACLFYGLRPGIADAIQAYLQAAIGNETWVLIPWELWLPSWRQRYSADTKLVVIVVQLRKSLHGHPESGCHLPLV